MKNIVVTGGAGFIGSHLCDRLIKNSRIICVDNLFTGNKGNIKHLMNNPHLRFIEHDIIEPLFLDDEKIDQIYNLACPASPVHYQFNAIRTIKANILGTINMLGLAMKHKARILQASTSEVYGDPLIHPQREDYRGNVSTISVRACYDEGKRCAETLMFDYHRQNKVDIKVVRVFNSIIEDEWTFTVKEGLPQIKRARELKEGDHNCLTIDSNAKVSIDNGSYIKIKSKHDYYYKIKTKFGRTLSITKDHGVLVYNKKIKKIIEKKPLDLDFKTDYLLIPNKIIISPMDKKEIILFESAKKYNIKTNKEILRLLKSEKKQIRNLLIKNHYAKNTINNYKHFFGISIPYFVFEYLYKKHKLNLREIFLKDKNSKATFPLKFTITNEFLWLLGFIVAEGGVTRTRKGNVLHISSNQKFLLKTKKIFDKLNIGCSSLIKGKQGYSIRINNNLFISCLSNEIGMKENSNTKRIPPWILALPSSRLKYFLNGYNDGDGSHSGEWVKHKRAFSTISEGLAQDLLFVLHRFGIVASIGKYKTSFKQKIYNFFRVDCLFLDNYNILDWDKGVKQRMQSDVYRDCVLVNIKSVKKIRYTGKFVYDFSVLNKENFAAGGFIFAHNTYGPRMAKNDGRVVSNFITQALEGKDLTVYGDGNQTRSFCYVSDMVEGMVKMMNCGGFIGPVNLGNPKEFTILELAKKIIGLTNSKSKIVFEELPEDDPKQRQPDICLAKRKLGWEPKIELEEGLKKTIGWFREN